MLIAVVSFAGKATVQPSRRCEAKTEVVKRTNNASFVVSQSVEEIPAFIASDAPRPSKYDVQRGVPGVDVVLFNTPGS